MEDKGGNELISTLERTHPHTNRDQLYRLTPVTPEYIQERSDLAYAKLSESGALPAVLQIARDHIEFGKPRMRLEMGWTPVPKLLFRGEPETVNYPATESKLLPTTAVGIVSPGVEVILAPKAPNGHFVVFTDGGGRWTNFRDTSEYKHLQRQNHERHNTDTSLYEEIGCALQIAKPYFENGRNPATQEIIAPLEKGLRAISLDSRDIAKWGKLV